jgi:hypothetical protein
MASERYGTVETMGHADAEVDAWSGVIGHRRFLLHLLSSFSNIIDGFSKSLRFKRSFADTYKYLLPLRAHALLRRCSHFSTRRLLFLLFCISLAACIK